jgi:GTPase SAR1 family protein
MLPFEAGCTHLVIGQSGSGKTQFIFKILRNKDVMFGESPPKVIRYYYGIWQDTFDDMSKEIQGLSFHKGLPTEDEILSFTDPNSHTLIILDDVMHEAANSEVVELIFTRISHHRCCSCFYLQQNAFIKGKNQVTIGMNAKYVEIFRSPRSLLQLQYLNSQIFPNKKGLLTDAYRDIMHQKSFGYLVIDLTAHCLDEMRVRSQIFPDEGYTVVYN